MACDWITNDGLDREKSQQPVIENGRSIMINDTYTMAKDTGYWDKPNKLLRSEAFSQKNEWVQP